MRATNLFYLLFVLLAISFVFFTFGCGEDDEEALITTGCGEHKAADLIGKWQAKQQEEGKEYIWEYTFHEDGMYLTRLLENGVVINGSQGIYKISEDNLTMIAAVDLSGTPISGNSSITYQFEVCDNTLTLANRGSSLHLTKIS